MDTLAVPMKRRGGSDALRGRVIKYVSHSSEVRVRLAPDRALVNRAAYRVPAFGFDPVAPDQQTAFS